MSKECCGGCSAEAATSDPAASTIDAKSAPEHGARVLEDATSPPESGGCATDDEGGGCCGGGGGESELEQDATSTGCGCKEGGDASPPIPGAHHHGHGHKHRRADKDRKDAGAQGGLATELAQGAVRTCLDVDGMCCDSEVALVRKRLERLPGVTGVSVNLVGGQVTVDHDPSATSDDRLARALSGAGLPSTVVDQESGATTHRQNHARRGLAGLPWSLVVTGVLFAASLASPWVEVLRWAGLAAALIGIWPISRRALAALRSALLEMNLLMTVAVIGAVVIGEWVEGAAVVFLFGVSAWLEERALERARDAIGTVLRLVPETAERAADGQQIPVRDVPVGTRLVVRAGGRVPLDGVVVDGDGGVDESALTGESVPVHKAPGEDVSAGTLLQRGYLEMESTVVSAESAVSRLARLVADAQSAKAPVERFVDRFAKVYTPAVMFLAIALAVVPPLLFGGVWGEWFYRALVLLVVACPCALVISTPVAVVSGLARAARMGVLIKGGVHLETLGTVRSVAFDKTGTLTEGRFGVVECTALNGFTTEEMHRWLALAEHRSSHPLAAALLDHAPHQPRHSEPDEALFYETIEGEGIHVQDGGRDIYVGNHRLAVRLGWHNPEEHEVFERWQGEGKTVVYVGVDGVLAGLHALADKPREEAAPAVAALRAMGLSTVMLTGDNAGAAEAVRAHVGVDLAESGLLPADKVEHVRALRERAPTAMVGDGINDAPALAAADVGVAMGVRGTAVAMETADVALMSDDLCQLAGVIALGRKALRTVKANIAFAIAVKAVVLALAALGVATLWMAVVADVGATLAVVLYSLRLLKDPR